MAEAGIGGGRDVKIRGTPVADTDEEWANRNKRKTIDLPDVPNDNSIEATDHNFMQRNVRMSKGRESGDDLLAAMDEEQRA